MSHIRSRKSAEAVLRWKTCLEIPLPFIASLFLAIFAVKISWAGLACLSNPCKYGICIDDVNGTFLCYCIDGYTGLLCQTNWDECWSNPCQNGGTCVDGIAHYNCTCPQGYQGEFCEQNIDECYSNPCHNNGTCIDGPNGYTCACPFGYVGNFCETDVSVCNDTHETRCLNGGLCTEGPGYTFNCTCPLGWEGKFCEESVDECISSPCENGGVCLDLQANYSCACPFGFSGRNCEVELEMCGDTSPCQNGAVCLVEDWLRVCYCVPDYHGDRCQFQYNECLLGPGCLNGGTCIDGVDGYDCSCNPGWSGNFCECWIINEDEMDCSYPFPPQITALTLPPTPVLTVPIWIKAKVPKTTSAVQNIPEKATTPNYFYSLLTECRPVWPFVTIPPKHTTKSAAISTKKTTFFELFTQRTKDIEVTEKYTTKRLNTTQTIPMSAIQTTPMTTKSSSTTEPTFKTTINATTISTTTKTMTQTTMVKTPLTPTITQTISTPQTIPTTTTTILTTTQTIPTTTTTTLTTTQTIPTTTTTTLTTTQTTSPITENIKTTTEIIPKTNQTTLITTQTTPNITQNNLTVTSPTNIQTALTATTPTTFVTEQSQTQVTLTTTETLKISKKDPQTTLSTTKITPISTTPIKTTLPVITEIETVKSTTQITTISSSTTTTAIATTEATTTKTLTSLTSTTPPGILKTTTECIDFTQTQQPLSTPMPWNCKKFPCLNGGTCLNTTNGIRCLCKSNWEGPFCDGKINIRLAGFSGSSYVSHRITNTHNIKINITARTVAPEGLILYSHLGPHIYMTLFMENGLLKFKFSCGIQTMLLSETQYNLNNGVDFIASITLNFIPPTKDPHHCFAAVRINNTLTMSGEQLAKGPHVDSGSAWIYIGGVPSRYVDEEEAPVLKGFVGCIHNLKIDGRSSGIFKDSFDSNEVTECKSLACLSNPCKSGSSCIEYNETWTCLCPSGFLGRACDRSVCKNNPCQFGATCIPFPGSGFICLCPVGKQGLFCENDTSTGYPLFASSVGGLSSFAAYKLPTEIHQDMLLTFKFLPYDMEQISLMIFIGQEGYHRPTSDHLSVSFIKGYVVLTWNLGLGPRRIFTEHPVPNTGRFFHTVQIGRAGQRAWLVVDNQRNVTGRSPGKLSQLNTRSVIYLGGHDSKNFSLLPHDLPLHTGFSGCLFDVELRTGQMLIKIEKTPPVFSRSVGQCGRNLCNEHSCENGGGCIHHGATFTCLCSDGWFGPTCAIKYNPCDSSRHNCSEGSTCMPLKHGFECDCPVGKKGKFCEINEDLSDVKLTGKRSYIALAIEGLHPFQSCIDMEIRPLSNYGLILYSGRPEGNTFWSLSLQNGVLELRVFPGVRRRKGDLLVIRSRRLLTLGSWHRIRAGRYGRRLFLWVEGTVNTGVLLPGENLPPIGSLVYIGGVSDLSTIPTGVSGKVLTPFQGCLRKFTSQWKVISLTKANILEGRNVEDCDGSVCGAEVCENGGTCYVNANNEPICTCVKHYTGSRCEIRMSCKEMRCQNGGRCAEIKSVTPQCFCPNGWSGPFCESGVAVKAPQFVGNSYLLIDRLDILSNRRRDTQQKVEVSFINLTFMTAEHDGILLWSSRKTDTEFIGIGMENGKMKFVWAWKEQNTTTVISKEQIADGGWHDLAISFDTNNITIMIDEQLTYMSNENYPGYPITTDGRFFLGGFPDSREVINETRGYFSNGFNGCLKKLAWEMESSILNFSNFAGENIRACDPFED